ncbi:MAG: hypothetical protein RL434_2388 [Pseudomonadota bacterium]|jgi:hypothetical protein
MVAEFEGLATSRRAAPVTLACRGRARCPRGAMLVFGISTAMTLLCFGAAKEWSLRAMLPTR